MSKALFRSLALFASAAAVSLAQHPDLDQAAHVPLQLLPSSVNGPSGYSPQQIRQAYGIDTISNQGEGQIIGIVDGFDYPEVESDLAVFDQTFGLPSCTKANGCLTVVYASGTKPPPNVGWTGETSLDVQWAHAVAPMAKIVLILAENGNTGTLLAAVPLAVSYGATTVNMSWGTLLEFPGETSLDSEYFNNPAVTYFNASGDDGNNLFGYPAASPLVVGCGGTSLILNAAGDILQETAWSGSGGGLSKYFLEPSYQLPFQTSGMRGIPDVAYDSNPNTGVSTYDSEYPNPWSVAGGTSASSPQWSAIGAIANSLRASMGRATIGTNFLNIIYANPTALHDITSGSNGNCGSVCTAGPGYDFVTGLGSPNVPAIMSALTSAP